jgi:hypothetical protein
MQLRQSAQFWHRGESDESTTGIHSLDDWQGLHRRGLEARKRQVHQLRHANALELLPGRLGDEGCDVINRTPEERRASAKKAHATARARREREAAARDDALKYAGGLREEIAALTHKLDELKRVEQINAISCVLTGKVLLRQEEIVAAAIPWARASGVYFLIDGAEVAYVGQSVNVHSRIGMHAAKQFDKYAFVPCEPDALNKLESLYIHCLRPKLNATNPDQSKAAPIKLNELIGVKGINK